MEQAQQQQQTQTALLTTCHLDAKIQFQHFLHSNTFQVALPRSTQISASAILSPAAKLILLTRAIIQRSWNLRQQHTLLLKHPPLPSSCLLLMLKKALITLKHEHQKRASMQDLKCVACRLKGYC